MPRDAESGGSNFTEKVTALWPPRRPRTEQPGLERTTVKAHVLAHVARSRRKPGAGHAAEFALPWNRKQPRKHPLELPLPPSRELPRGSQTTPRLGGDEAPPAVVAASAPAAQESPRAVTTPEASGPLAAPAADAWNGLAAPAANAWDEPLAPGAAAGTEMPPLYAGISPYRHALPATLFELTAVSPPALAPAPAPMARPPRGPRCAKARPARRAARSPLHGRPLPLLVILLAVALWSVAYWQTWTALSMNARCRAALEMLSSALGGSPADDHR